MEIFFTHSETNWFRMRGLFRVTAFSVYNRKRRNESVEMKASKPGILIQIPELWLLEWGCNGLKNFLKGLRDVKEGGISARKAVQMWGLSMKKSALQVGRVTFDPRKGPSRPSPIFFFLGQKMKTVHRLANRACKPQLSACPQMRSVNQWKSS